MFLKKVLAYLIIIHIVIKTEFLNFSAKELQKYFKNF